jgi:hypothetical protein
VTKWNTIWLPSAEMLGESAAPPTEFVVPGAMLTSAGGPGAEGKLPSAAAAPRSTTNTPELTNGVPAHCVLFDVKATQRPSFESAVWELSSPATPLVVSWNLEISVVVPAIVSRT